MKPRTLLAAALLTASAALFVSGCSASLCERKDNWLARNCAGGSVTSSPDPTCEAKVKTCNAAQMAQFRGYVECLEASAECSLDSMNRCGQQFPGGVNLLCG